MDDQAPSACQYGGGSSSSNTLLCPRWSGTWSGACAVGGAAACASAVERSHSVGADTSVRASSSPSSAGVSVAVPVALVSAVLLDAPGVSIDMRDCSGVAGSAGCSPETAAAPIGALADATLAARCARSPSSAGASADGSSRMSLLDVDLSTPGVSPPRQVSTARDCSRHGSLDVYALFYSQGCAHGGAPGGRLYSSDMIALPKLPPWKMASRASPSSMPLVTCSFMSSSPLATNAGTSS